MWYRYLAKCRPPGIGIGVLNSGFAALLIFRQLFDPQSSTYTYLLGDGDSGEAVLIDPVFEQAPRDSALMRELGLKLQCTLETHVHADHVTGASALKERLGLEFTRWEWRLLANGFRHAGLRPPCWGWKAAPAR